MNANKSVIKCAVVMLKSLDSGIEPAGSRANVIVKVLKPKMARMICSCVCAENRLVRLLSFNFFS